GSGGAFNCAARGVGAPDLVYAAATGQTWFELCPTIRYELHGCLRPGVVTKDLFLWLAQTFGDHSDHNIEFGGPALATLDMDARRTLSTMGTELNAEFSVFEPDDVLLNYIRERNPAPFEAQYPDADATYAERRDLDLATIEPLVALPDPIIRNPLPVSPAAGSAGRPASASTRITAAKAPTGICMIWGRRRGWSRDPASHPACGSW